MTFGEFFNAVATEIDGPQVPESLRFDARALTGVEDSTTGPGQQAPEVGRDGRGIITYETPGVGQNGESSN